MVATATRTILENLDRIPNDDERTKVAIIAYDTSLYFFSMPVNTLSDLLSFVLRCYLLLFFFSLGRRSQRCSLFRTSMTSFYRSLLISS